MLLEGLTELPRPSLLPYALNIPFLFIRDSIHTCLSLATFDLSKLRLLGNTLLSYQSLVT